MFSLTIYVNKIWFVFLGWLLLNGLKLSALSYYFYHSGSGERDIIQNGIWTILLLLQTIGTGSIFLARWALFWLVYFFYLQIIFQDASKPSIPVHLSEFCFDSSWISQDFTQLLTVLEVYNLVGLVTVISSLKTLYRGISQLSDLFFLQNYDG